jgi:beta-glucosidase
MPRDLHRFLVLATVLLPVSLALAAPARAADPAIEKKVDALLARMTLEEKIGQLEQMTVGVGGVDTPVETDKGPLADALKLTAAGGLGSVLNVTNVHAAAELQAAARRSRLGIPVIVGFDVIHGYRTIFPIPLGSAATWNPALAERSTEIAAREASAVGIHWTFAPMVDIARDARWGRIAEGAGEDPVLGQAFARARVRGFHRGGVATCAKHYVAYGAAEGGRDYNSVDMSESMLRDVYLPPFRAAVEAGTDTLMSSFNTINGIPATENRHTLTEILRGEWGFDGFVVSDWEAVSELMSHGVAGDCADAARLALDAGVDMEMVSTCYAQSLARLVAEGAVKTATIDQAVRRVLRVKYRLGLFEKKAPDLATAGKTLFAPEHRQAAREIARESIVLLKNDPALLPAPEGPGIVAVVGPLADAGADQLGSWSGDGRGEDSVTVLQAVRARLAGKTEVLYAKGCDVRGGSDAGFADAADVALRADKVIAVLGESADMSGEAGSRAFLNLPGRQQALLEALVATGKPVVLVLMAGRPLDIRWAAEHVPSILMAWQPGTEGGPAIADVIFGDTAPSGHLPVTWPRSVGQEPLYASHLPTGRPPTDDRFTSRYVDESSDPLFPFGYGLSYTTFAYSDLALSAKTMPVDGHIDVTLRVKNTGSRPGQEVVQLYVRDLVASRSRPVRQLEAFDKVALEPGEDKTVTLTLEAARLGFHDDAGRYVVEPGAFKLRVGGSSRADLEADFEVR